MVTSKRQRTVGRFFHRAAVAAVAGTALLIVSGCGSGNDSNSGGGNEEQGSTLTRAYVPLHAGDMHTFFAKFSDDDTDTTSIEESVSGPTASINGIDVNVFPVATTQVTTNLFGSKTVLFTTFQNVTDRGLINYGVDSFQAFDPYGPLQRHAQIGRRIVAPLVLSAAPSHVSTRAQELVESLRYVPNIVLPFGLERGRSTTIQRLDFQQVYSSNPPTTYESQGYRFTNEGRETVTVPMGTFDCIKIKQEVGSVDLNEVTQVNRFWYAENVGLIQYKETYPNETPSSGLSYQAFSASVGGKQYP